MKRRLEALENLSCASIWCGFLRVLLESAFLGGGGVGCVRREGIPRGGGGCWVCVRSRGVVFLGSWEKGAAAFEGVVRCESSVLERAPPLTFGGEALRLTFAGRVRAVSGVIASSTAGLGNVYVANDDFE